ncbi:MAG: hypothetical protein JNK38_01105 [Acidobacteria bacterium]|nr:hypothetical protein [Acidobacteriota bacterium]
MSFETWQILVGLLLVVGLFVAVWLVQSGRLDGLFATSALTRIERDIIRKLDEIATAESRQSADQKAKQRAINKIEVKIIDLKKERLLLLREIEEATRRDKVRLSELEEELRELRTREASLINNTTVEIPVNGLVEIRHNGQTADETVMEFTPGRFKANNEPTTEDSSET